MTNVRRPIHLQLRPAAPVATSGANSPLSASTNCHLSPSTSEPSLIIPHLFIGAQEQTNRETINRLDIKYILSLGLLPIISNGQQPVTPTSPVATSQQQAAQLQQQPQQQISIPSPNSSLDFKIRIRSTQSNKRHHHNHSHNHHNHHHHQCLPMKRDENNCVKSIRSVQCKCINIADNSDQLIIKYFDEAHNFIDEARRKKCNILIHCLAGISRSPTFAIAYLMRLKSLHWRDAYDLVKLHRPQVDPNLSFIGQLRVYSKTLRSHQPTKPPPANSLSCADSSREDNSEQEPMLLS